MSTFIKLGNKSLRMDRNDSIYVDKSLLISNLNKVVSGRERFLCISRPRRFGKSMAANMTSAYYDESCDSRPLFEDLKIAKEPSFETHLNKYPVIKMDIAGFMSNLDEKKDIALKLKKQLLQDLRECYKEYLTEEENTPVKALLKIFDKTQKKFIFIIDEWDALFRELPNSDTEQKEFLDFFRSLFKNGDTSSSIALCYMTGILPIKKYNTQSALNNFREFTMLKPFFMAPYIGFTQEEVKPLCEKYSMDFNDIKAW